MAKKQLSFGQLILVPLIMFGIMMVGGTDPQKAVLISLGIAVAIKIIDALN